MNILKAIILTTILILIKFLILFGINFFTDNISIELLINVLGIGDLISTIIAYLLIFIIFWKPKFRLNKKDEFSGYNLKIITLLFVIVIGLEFAERPFFDFEKIVSYFRQIELEKNYYEFNGFNISLIYRIIGIILLAPILEELFFRKFLLIKLLEKYDKIIAIGISSLCFSLIHFDSPRNLFPTLIFGIISGIIYLKTKRIGYSIILHLIYNTFWLLLLIYGEYYSNFIYGLEFNYAYWILFVFGVITTLFGLKKITTANNS
jgi:membrane protease YdiL (CAAX protease family)